MAVDILQVDENSPISPIIKRETPTRINPLIHELNKNIRPMFFLLQHKLQQPLNNPLTTFLVVLTMEIKKIQISVIIIEYRFRS
jgi:hypothetical protein